MSQNDGTVLANLSDGLGAVHMTCSHVMLMLKGTAGQFKFSMSVFCIILHSFHFLASEFAQRHGPTCDPSHDCSLDVLGSMPPIQCKVCFPASMTSY